MAQHGAYDDVVGKAQCSQCALNVHASVAFKAKAKDTEFTKFCLGPLLTAGQGMQLPEKCKTQVVITRCREKRLRMVGDRHALLRAPTALLYAEGNVD
jgi:hypothetical protein